LQVLYLIFNEGYTATSGRHLHRVDLSAEAIRLTRAVLELVPEAIQAHRTPGIGLHWWRGTEAETGTSTSKASVDRFGSIFARSPYKPQPPTCSPRIPTHHAVRVTTNALSEPSDQSVFNTHERRPTNPNKITNA
ncbi:MAG: DUF6596 domain-containing protein, partial [Egibacteraceae bacterium]